MGADGSGACVAQRIQPLTRAPKPPDDRLYGRLRGPKLRPRQQHLLGTLLPRMRFPLDHAADPLGAFPVRPDRLCLEVGSGGGEHALAQAAAHPGTGLIACEVFANGLCSLLSRIAPGETDPPPPANLMIWDEDARILLRALPPGCLDGLFLLFPDPWPKMRHIQRRFVHPGQLPLLARVLRPGAEWRIATDDPTYQAWVTDVMAGQDLFEAAPPALTRPDGWPPTRYETKALHAGRTPRYWLLRRTTIAPRLIEARCSNPVSETDPAS